MARDTVIAIVGAGLMGTGLVRVFRPAGWTVRVSDPVEAARARLVAAFPDVMVTADLGEAVADAALVIEAAPERPALKQALFAELARLAAPDALLATNSSVIPVGTVAALVPDEQAGRVLGTHFWNPPDIVPLVEVIAGPRTAPESIDRAIALLESVGKEPVPVRRDVVPGNRLQHALWREAMALVDEGVCTPADVDHIVKRGFGLRLAVLGPLENADLVGLELTQHIHEVVLPTLSRATTPSPGLIARRARGREGVRAGAGFHDGWTEDKVAALRARLARHLAMLLAQERPPR